MERETDMKGKGKLIALAIAGLFLWQNPGGAAELVVNGFGMLKDAGVQMGVFVTHLEMPK